MKLNGLTTEERGWWKNTERATELLSQLNLPAGDWHKSVLTKYVQDFFSDSELISRYSFLLKKHKEFQAYKNQKEIESEYYYLSLMGFTKNYHEQDVLEYIEQSKGTYEDKDIEIWKREKRVAFFFGQSIDRFLKNKLKLTIQNDSTFDISFENTISFKVSKSQFTLFFKKYSKSPYIEWESMCFQQDIEWSDEIIDLGKEYWNWKYLVQNPSINWTFEMLYNFRNYIDQDDFRGELVEFEQQNEYKKKKYGYVQFQGDLNPEALIKIEDWTLNKNGVLPAWAFNQEKLVWTEAMIQEHFMHINWKELSKSSNVDWSIKLLRNHQNSWEWREICKNEAIPLNKDHIAVFVALIDFKSLSWNKKFKWDINFIKNHFNKFDIRGLIVNTGIVWNVELCELYMDEIQSHKDTLTRSADSWYNIESYIPSLDINLYDSP